MSCEHPRPFYCELCGTTFDDPEPLTDEQLANFVMGLDAAPLAQDTVYKHGWEDAIRAIAAAFRAGRHSPAV